MGSVLFEARDSQFRLSRIHFRHEVTRSGLRRVIERGEIDGGGLILDGDFVDAAAIEIPCRVGQARDLVFMLAEVCEDLPRLIVDGLDHAKILKRWPVRAHKRGTGLSRLVPNQGVVLAGVLPARQARDAT